jgi:hypothetical protein
MCAVLTTAEDAGEAIVRFGRRPPAILVMAGPATQKTKAMRHARISAGILSANIRDRTAPLPEVPAESDVAVEA